MLFSITLLWLYLPYLGEEIWMNLPLFSFSKLYGGDTSDRDTRLLGYRTKHFLCLKILTWIQKMFKIFDSQKHDWFKSLCLIPETVSVSLPSDE